jgi:hypothetical protein
VTAPEDWAVPSRSGAAVARAGVGAQVLVGQISEPDGPGGPERA